MKNEIKVKIFYFVPQKTAIKVSMQKGQTLKDLRLLLQNMDKEKFRIKDEDTFSDMDDIECLIEDEKSNLIEEFSEKLEIKIIHFYFNVYADNSFLEKFYWSLSKRLNELKDKLPKPYCDKVYVFLKNGEELPNNILNQFTIKDIKSQNSLGEVSVYMKKACSIDKKMISTEQKIENEEKEEIKISKSKTSMENDQKEKEEVNNEAAITPEDEKKAKEKKDIKAGNENEIKKEDIFDDNEEKENKDIDIQNEKIEDLPKLKEGIVFIKNKRFHDHVYIEVKSKDKNLEVYDINDENQEGYKLINFKENIYFTICTIFIKEKTEKIKFGIRKFDSKQPITSKDIEITDKNLFYYFNFERFELFLYKDEKNIFNIYNEPKFNNKNDLFLILQKLYEFDFYECDLTYLKKATSSINYEIIIDKIMEIGINHKLSEKLIMILQGKNIDIYKAANYLEKNRAKYKPNIFSEVSPKLISNLHQEKDLKIEDGKNDNKKLINRQLLLCCDKNIPKSLEKKKDDENLIKNIKEYIDKEDFSNEDLQKALEIEDINDNFILTFNHLEKLNKLEQKKIENYNLPFELFKKIYEYKQKNTGENSCILTLETLKKINQLDILISANIPIIIQGFTSAGKSFLSRYTLEINNKKFESKVLSESTTEEDLLGKEFLDENNLIKFYPGIILNAYIEGITIILDEGDLAKPEILSCIVGTLTKDELIINNEVYYRNENYNIILTMNGEALGFNEKYRYILPSYIITKFYILNFKEIDEKESKKIFIQQLNQSENYILKDNVKQSFIELHNRMSLEKQNIIDPIVTLRNLKNCIYLDKSDVRPRISSEISYIGRFPKEERKKYENIIKNFGNLELDQNRVDRIKKKFNELPFICGDDINFENNSYFRALYLGLTACEAGFHPLLVGKSGCGLTTVSKIIASIYNKEYEYLLFNNEISDEDLIGYYQPLENKEMKENYKLSSLIEWKKGPIYNSLERGIPVLLDDIGYAKNQILESLNSILETNVKYNELKFKVLQNKGDILTLKPNSKFVVIGNIKEEHIKHLSKALLNRFVVIYLDELRIDENNIEDLKIVNKTIESLNNRLNQYNINTNDYNNEKNFHAKIKINPKISENIVKLFKSKKINLSIKDIIKSTEKLCLIYQKLNCKINLEDCFSLLELFEEKINIKKIEEILQRNKIEIEQIFRDIFINYIDSQKESDFYFYDPKNINLNDALKMILGILLTDLSETSIFIQGYPGSGKSCAGRFYGAKRAFNSRDPIISVNCSSDLVLESLIGTYSFKDSKFEFVNGPLLEAIEKGLIILLDELNLCNESIFSNLFPIFKAKVNEEISLKYVPKKIKIKPGFFIIATGNFSKEKGRKKIPSFILDEINWMKVEHFSYDKNILDKIIDKKEFSSIINVQNNKKYKISTEQIIKIFESVKEITNINFSIRQIKCLLQRMARFNNLEFVYIIIGYILPQLNIKEDLIIKLLQKIDEIMEYNNLQKLINFVKSEVTMIYKENNKRYIKKDDIELSIDFNCSNYPQASLQTLFWIRMSCSYINSIPSDENLLLIGPTSYKETIIKDWLNSIDKNPETYYLTKNTEVQNLIGASSLDDEENIDNLLAEMKENLKELDLDLDDKNFNENLEKKENKINIQCMKYIKECYNNFINLQKQLLEKKNHSNLKTITSFHIGIIPKSYIYGKILILKGIENPQPSVIERLNSILENPRFLVLTEDNQGIYNNQIIFEKINNSKNRISLPNNSNFKIIFTSRNVNNKSLSEAFKSRCTLIYCPSYKEKKYLLMELKPNDNYEKILKKNLNDMTELEREISAFRTLYKENIEFLSFIRLCKTAKNILETSQKNIFVYKSTEINYKYIVGISVLRSIFDKLNAQDRISKIKKYLKDFLPPKLFDLLINIINTNNNYDIPFEIIEDKNNCKKYVKSLYSEISIQVKDAKKECLEGIIWTRSSVDMIDALLTSLASNTLLILEGPPGRGKTIITKKFYEFLGLKYERINFSPSTKKEEIFSMVVPIIEEQKIHTKNLPQKLLKILTGSKGNLDCYENGLLLDEMNLAKDELLENLYSYLGAIKNNLKKEYTSPDGRKYSNIGNIAVTITMNGSTMSNSRTSLSDSFLNLSHSFKLQNYSKDEIEKLIREKLKIFDKKDIDYVVYKYNSYINNNKNNTFRDIMKMGKYFQNINTIGKDELLDLILYPEKKINVSDWDLKLEKNYLYFGKSDNYIKYNFPSNKLYRKEIRTLFSPSQKEALMKILVGIKAENTILLTGEINSGKTFLLKQLADIIGIKLRIIQFTKETNSSDLIGKLKLTKKEISLLKDDLNYIQNYLIKNEFKEITKFIIYNSSMDIPRLLEILKQFDGNKEPKINSVKKILEKNTILKNINFDFIYSFLINAMKYGEWVLLDDIHFAKAEIERLMSLLEEEPTLVIYENEQNKIFIKPKNKNRQGINNEIDIHPDFRLFITSSNEKIISQAIKSRCLVVNLRQFEEPEDYAILIANSIMNSKLEEDNIINVSKYIANSFSKMKIGEEEGNYILKNYKLSSMNLVHFSKLIQNSKEKEINGKIIAKYLKYSIFSGFKSNLVSQKIIDFKDNFKLQKNIELRLIPNTKRNHEFYISQFEINIISYYCKNNFSENQKNHDDEIKKLNEQISDLMGKESNITNNLIKWDITEDSIIKEIKMKELTGNLDSFTFRELEIYYDEIKEAFDLLSMFIDKYSNIYCNFFFLKYLKDILCVIKNICNDNISYNDKIKKAYKYEDFNKYKIDKKNLFYFKNIIEGFNSIFPPKTNFLELDKSIISLFYNYYYNFQQNENKKIITYFRLLTNNQLKSILKNYTINIPNANNGIIKFYNYLTSCEYDIKIDNVSDDINNMIIRVKNKIIKVKDIDDNLKELINFLGNNKKDSKEETINQINKNLYFINNYDYLLKYYQNCNNEEDIIKNYWYYHFYVIKEKKFDRENIKKIISPEIYYFIDGITYILENDNLGDWYNIKQKIILGFKFFEGIREINEKNNIYLNDGFDLFKNKDLETNIEKILNIYNNLEKFFCNKNAKEYWEHISSEINEKIKLVEKEDIKIRKKNKKERYKREYRNVLEGFKSFSEYNSFINDNKNQIEILLENIDDKNFEIQFNKKIMDLENKINELKSQIKKNKEDEKSINISRSEILTKIANKPASNNVRILHIYYKLCDIIEKIDKNKSLADQFNIIVWDYLENFAKDLNSFANSRRHKENKMNFYKGVANYILIKKMIINEKRVEGEIYATKLVEFFNKLFDFKSEQIEDLSSKFRDNEFLYIPKLEISDIERYFELEYNKDIHCNSNDIEKLELDDFEIEKYNEFKNNGLPEVKKFYSGMNNIISKIESEDWNNEFNWLKKSFEELKNESWKKPNQLLIKQKHELYYDETKKIYDGQKVDIKSLFACFESKKAGKTKKWRTFPEIFIQQISQKMENKKIKYDYGYRIMELYDFLNFRDNISESMIIIIDTIDKIIEEKFGKNLNLNIINIISRFYEEFIIEKIVKDEIPDLKNVRLFKIFQYILFLLCLNYEDIFLKEIHQSETEINNKKLNLTNIVKEISSKSKNILLEKNKEYEIKVKKYEEDIKREYEKEKVEFSRNKNYDEQNLDFDERFKNSEEYQNYLVIISNFTKPNKDDFENNKNYINMFEDIEKIIDDIQNKNDPEDIRDIINKIKIEVVEKLNIIDNTLFKQYKKLKEDINKNIEHLNDIKKLDKKLNFNEIINSIPNDIKKDNFIDVDKLKNLFKKKEELIEIIENLKIYNCNIFEIQNFKDNINSIKDNIENIKYIDKIKEEFIKSNLNFIFTKELKPIFLHKNMKINLGVYILLDNSSNNIGKLRIKNNSKDEVNYKIIQTDNNKAININKNQRPNKLKKYEDLEIEFILIDKKEQGLKTSNFEIILLDEGLQESNKCSIEAFIYVIPFIMKFNLNHENYYYNKNNNNTIKIKHYIENLEISYKIPGIEIAKGPKVGFHLKTISKEKIGINTEKNGIIHIIDNFEYNDSVQYNLSLFLNSKNFLNFEVFYEKPKYFGLILYDSNQYYAPKRDCLGEIKILKDKGKVVYLYNMTTQIMNKININYDKYKINVKYDDLNNNCIEPGKKIKLEIINSNLIDGESKIYINDEKKYIKILNLNFPKLEKNNKEIYCIFNGKSKDEIENSSESKMFKIYVINNEFKLFKKYIHESSLNYFSSFLIYKNKIIDKIYEEKNYIYKPIDENKDAYGLCDNGFIYGKTNNMIIILKQYKKMSIFTQDSRENFKGKINDENNFKTKIISENINDINLAINFLLDCNNINFMKFDTHELSQLEITKEKISINNIIKFLIKFYFDKSLDYTKDDLEKNYGEIFSKREINSYIAIPNNVNLFIKKLLYIISFVSLCISPGELLENEINEIILNDKEEENENELYKKNKELDEQFEKNIKSNIKAGKNDIYNEDFIFFNGEIYTNEKKDIFEKFEIEIKNKTEEKFNNETNEQYFEISEETENEIINKIKNNEINCFNLLIYLKRFEKYIISLPYIFSKEKRRITCISNIQIIYDFMLVLIESNIYKETDFQKHIINYFNEFKYLLSDFSCFNISELKKIDNFEFNFVQKCKLPSDDRRSISDLDYIKENKELINLENTISSPLEQKNFEEPIENYDDNKNRYRSTHFKGSIDNIFDSLYEGGKDRIHDTYDPQGENKHKGYILNQDINSESQNEENSEEDLEIKNYNNMAINNLNLIKENNKKVQNKNIRIESALFDYEKFGKTLNKKNEQNISSEKMLEDVLTNIKWNKDMKNFTFGSIKNKKNNDDIKDCICEIDQSLDNELKNKNINDIYIKCSNFMQNIIINIIRKKIIDYNSEIIYNLENSYIDLTVDISQMMSEQQRIASLIIAYGLFKSLTMFGVNIRLSAFGESDYVWLLSDKFENDNINIQLNRLRDALATNIKRFQSFPADALVKLKHNFENKKLVGKYVQILISSLISPQVLNEEIDWDEIHCQKIIVFGLKTNFEDNCIKGLEEDINNLLNIKYRKDKKPRSITVSQKIFDPYDINKNNLKEGEKDFTSLIEELISELKAKTEKNENIFQRKILLQLNQNKNKKESIKGWLEGFLNYIKNEDGNKFFAQNKNIYFSKNTNIYEKIYSLNFPSLEELNGLSNKNYLNNNVLEEIIKFENENFSSTFNNYFENNFASGKVFSSSGGTISIKGLKKWICTGFSNTNIFEKKGADNVKKYIISFIFDISKSALTAFNSTHAISTIIAMLITPSIIENNEEIFIDVIINTSKGIKITDYNTKCEEFQKSEKLNEIINIIISDINNSCSPGTCLYTAFRLLSERKEEEKIFFITDNFITDKNEFELSQDILGKLESSGIELITIGIGSFPYGIDKLYSKCCYTQYFTKLNECLLICFNNLVNESSLDTIRPSVIIQKELDDNEYNSLSKYISEQPIDKKLETSIKSKPLYIFNMLLKNDGLLKPGLVSTKIYNPEEEIYINGIFKNLRKSVSRILIVLLYLGESNKDSNISEEIFRGNEEKKGTGYILRKKGLEYTIVYNYKDAIDELTINEDGHCKYLEAWIFSSDGSGEYPKGGKTIYDSDKNERRGDGRKVTKEDNSKELIPFLETVSEFNRKGGALLLFCDNEPFTFEVNLLLSKYLNFDEINKERANFIMGGNYVRPPGVEANITVKSDNSKSKRATFDSRLLLDYIGKEETKRLSLRVGMKYFNEGITLSYAKTYDNSENYEPFNAFAYLTDKEKDKPFILYYDPKIDPLKVDNRGPIVVHGGFTSAFYEFTKEGTGLLIISIACWLGRIEEGIENKYFKPHYEFFVPAINRSISNQIFDDWYKIKSVYSILILDVSGSMKTRYESLVKMVNSILERQKDKEENEIVIIIFGEDAKKLNEENNFKKLYESNKWEIKTSDFNQIETGDTKYYAAFEEAYKYRNPNKEFILRRILFFTDGQNFDGLEEKIKLGKICEEMKELNYKIHFFGFGDFNVCEELKPDYVYKEKDANKFDDLMKTIERHFVS